MPLGPRLRPELDALLEIIPAMIWIKDAEGRVLRANRAAAESMGKRMDEILGRLSHELHPAEGDACLRDDREVLETGEPKLGIVEPYTDGAGEKRWVKTDKVPFRDEAGKIAGVIVFVQDITEQKRLEGQLIESEKMAAVGQLAGGMAHEFNNMLGGIMGLAHLIVNSLGPQHPSREDAQEIVATSTRAAQLVRQLLTFSRRQVADRRPLDLNEVARRVAGNLPGIIGDRIAVRLDLRQGLRPILADSAQIEHVLINFALNARDAMPGGGAFTIETHPAPLGAEMAFSHGRLGPGDYVALTVSDTGPGAPPEIRTRLFEPFFTTKKIPKGAGLGLAIIYGIVQEHEGAIDLRRPGRGFECSLYFPAASSTAAAAPPLPAARGRAAGGTVLLAEDDRVARRVLTRMLEKAGYRVLAAEDGQAAIDLFRQNPGAVSLCLFDVLMPRKEGPAAYLEIVAQRPGLRVLFMSGYAGSEAHALLSKERWPFIAKPFTAEELDRRILDVLAPRPA